ncbi:gem-associated protein 8 [Ctenodactylus gundi]
MPEAEMPPRELSAFLQDFIGECTAAPGPRSGLATGLGQASPQAPPQAPPAINSQFPERVTLPTLHPTELIPIARPAPSVAGATVPPHATARSSHRKIDPFSSTGQDLRTVSAHEVPPSEVPTPWYSHPVYTRYWHHYHQGMAWMRSHQLAYQKAVESCCSLQGAKRSVLKEEIDTESDAEVECDVSNMEITEELRQFFAQTEKHREERRRQQQLDAERLREYVNADHGLYYNTRRTTEPPSERPGERRQAEMKRLYGDSAAKIQAMEAALQLTFNKHCDLKQPKYWPVIPLKF